MSETKNTLAQGMFVREHTFKNGTRVMNVAINVSEFSNFILENMSEDENGNNWVNLKFIPNTNVGENKLSHTPILNDYIRQNAEQALESLAAEVLTPSAEEREITETPTKKSKVKTVKKAIKKAIKAVKGDDDLPF